MVDTGSKPQRSHPHTTSSNMPHRSQRASRVWEWSLGSEAGSASPCIVNMPGANRTVAPHTALAAYEQTETR
jgi:hypothetical protein